MKISTKFNLFVGFFFFFVFLAVFYSYCGGLNVCYSFPFLNGFRGGSMSKAKVMMTSYIIDEKGDPRDDASNTIYFYSKVKGEPQPLKEITRKPGDKGNTREKTGPGQSHNPPADITGKAALDILKKANVSLEEANRELYREEKVDKQVDRELPILIQSTAVTKYRGDLGLRHMHPRIHPMKKPPRRLRKKLKLNRINRLSKQDRIDRALAKKLERADTMMRMRGEGPGNKSNSSKTSYLRNKMTKAMKQLNEIKINQTEDDKNFVNEAVSPLDIIKYRNEAITYTKRHGNEAERRNTSLTLNATQHLSNNSTNKSTTQFENKSPDENGRINRKKNTPFHPEKGLLQKKVRKHFAQIKISPKNKLFSNKTGIGRYGNNMTSSNKVEMKTKKKETKRVEEGSGSDGGSGMKQDSVSTGELVRTIRNINDQHVKLALQSALNKDQQQLKNDVLRIKSSLKESYRPFNLTRVLRELVTAAENDQGGANIPRMKEGLLLKRRNSDWDRPLVRVKRLGRIRRRNDESERTLVRVKRREDEDEDPRDLNKPEGRQFARADKGKNSDRANVVKGKKKVNHL